MTDQPPPRRRPEDDARPVFHFTAPTGWINDPNGLSRWGDTYHLFYQFNPAAPVHDAIQWGHAVSTDLVTWADRPVALRPEPGGPDRDGCWSGVLVDDDGTPTIVYSAHADGRQLPALALGDADLDSWVKDGANPVIPAPPADLDVVAFRDHCVWRRDGVWYQLIGSGIRGRGGTALLYASDDLRRWEYRGPVLIGDPDRDGMWSGAMWECVDLFELDGTDLLLFSAWEDEVTLFPAYFTGRFDGSSFVPSGLHHLDLGGRYCYAPQTFDDRGRRVLIGWMQEGRAAEDVLAAGWSGCLTVPRELRLRADGTLHQSPVAELSELRTDPIGVPVGPLTRPAVLVEDDFLAGDIELDLTGDPAAVVELEVLGDHDSGERTVIGVDWGAAAARIDRSASSLDPGAEATELGGTVPIAGGTVHLRVLIDRSALEVFVNGVAIAARVYPTRRGSRVRLVQVSGAVSIVGGGAWRIQPRGDDDLIRDLSTAGTAMTE